MIEWTPIGLSLKLAFITTLVLLVIAIPLALWLSQKRNIFKSIIEAVVSIPLVLPPTVLGFYLLQAFSPNNPIGAWLEKFLHIRLVFSFEGLLLASVIYSMPFMVQPIKSGFRALPTHLKDASYSLGKSRWQTLFKVLLPNIKPAILTAVGLTFAHTLGEFGVVLMIGGNIPNSTRTASIAIYDEVEAFHFENANNYALILLAISFLLLILLYGSNKINNNKFY